MRFLSTPLKAPDRSQANRAWRLAAIALAVVALTALQVGGVAAGTKAWNNPAGGSWSNGDNWDPVGVPGAGDDVIISVDGTYTVTLADPGASINSLTIGGASGTQILLIHGTSAAPLSVTGSVTVGAAGIVQLSDASEITAGGGVHNSGQIATIGVGSIRSITAELHNMNQMVVVGPGLQLLGPYAHENSGTITVGVSDIFTIGTGGNLTMPTAGTIELGAAAQLEIEGTLTATNSSVAGDGHMHVAAGGTLVANDLTVGDDLTNDGTVELGSLEVTNGTFHNAAAVVSNGYGGSTKYLTAELDNSGTIDLYHAGFTIETSTADHVNSGTITLHVHSTHASYGLVIRMLGGSFVNAATGELYAKGGGIVVVGEVPVTNYGTLRADPGQYVRLRNVDFTREPGSELAGTGSFEFEHSSATIQGPGSFLIPEGQTVSLLDAAVTLVPGVILEVEGTLWIVPTAYDKCTLANNGGDFFINATGTLNLYGPSTVDDGSSILEVAKGFENHGLMYFGNWTNPPWTPNAKLCVEEGGGAIDHYGRIEIWQGASARNTIAAEIDYMPNSTVFVEPGAVYKRQASCSSSGAPPLSITTTSLPEAIRSVPYSATLAAEGGTLPLAWSLESGSLPVGLTLASDGTLSGTPAELSGMFDITVRVDDSAAGTDTQDLTIKLYPAAPPTLVEMPELGGGESYVGDAAPLGADIFATGWSKDGGGVLQPVLWEPDAGDWSICQLPVTGLDGGKALGLFTVGDDSVFVCGYDIPSPVSGVKPVYWLHTGTCPPAATALPTLVPGGEGAVVDGIVLGTGGAPELRFFGWASDATGVQRPVEWVAGPVPSVSVLPGLMPDGEGVIEDGCVTLLTLENGDEQHLICGTSEDAFGQMVPAVWTCTFPGGTWTVEKLPHELGDGTPIGTGAGRGNHVTGEEANDIIPEEANDISVVGALGEEPNDIAVLWTKTGEEDWVLHVLPSMPGYANSVAYDLTGDEGHDLTGEEGHDIIGAVYNTADDWSAVKWVWSDATQNATITDLNNTIWGDPHDTEGSLRAATALAGLPGEDYKVFGVLTDPVPAMPSAAAESAGSSAQEFEGAGHGFVMGGAELLAVDDPPARIHARLEASVHPNPFAASANVSFGLSRAGHARVAVHGIDGRLVATLLAGHLEAGLHRVAWDGRTVSGGLAAPGIYFVSVKAEEGTVARRIVLVR